MMNNIGTLYTYELKKIANRKLVWIVGMIMIALSMFLSVSDLVTSSSYYGETSVSAYQAMKFNKDNAEKLSGMAIDDTLLREMQEDCANESKDHTKSQAVSNVFSIEYYRKTDAIILCSQYGKKQLFISKILAGMTFSIASAIILFAATLFSSLLVYGTDGFHAALQLAFPLSSLNISVGGSVLVLLVNLIVISMVYGSLIMLLSAILKSNVAVMAIPVGIMILTMMVDIPYQFRLASQVYDLLPTNILNKTELWDDRLICIWGKYFTNFQIAPFLYVVFAVLLVIIGMAIYQRHQVQAR